MATRVVEGKKPYTGGDAIDINQNKVISLKLRDENNLIIYDSGDDEIYVDLQLADGIEPTDAFPVGVTTGRVLVADEWDKTGTLICAKTTSGDNIKLLYADDGTLWIDNGTGTFKQIYLSTDIATILTDYATKEYVDAHDTIISSTEPEDPYEGMIWYNTGTDKLKVYNGASWQDIGSGGGGSSYTAGYGIDIDANDEISVDTSEIATQSDLSSKQDELVSGTNIKTINNESLLGSGDITISGGGADIEYKTQAEYDALPSSKLTDGKHYVIYTADTPTPPSPGRQPGVNTIAYYPLATDVNDASGNNINLTNHGITFSGGYAILETTNQTSTQGPYASYSGGITGYKTISCWFYKTGTTNGMLCIGHDDGSLTDAYFQLRTQNPNGFSLSTSGGGTFNNDITNNSYTINFNQRHLVTITQNVAQNSGASSGNLTVYLDGNLYGMVNYYMNRPLCWFGSATEGGYYYNFPGKFSNLIIEDKERTAQEVADYYDQTKGDYGIS